MYISKFFKFKATAADIILRYQFSIEMKLLIIVFIIKIFARINIFKLIVYIFHTRFHGFLDMAFILF